MVEKSVCAIYDEFEGSGASVVFSVEAVGPECVFVEGGIVRSKYWVGILKFLK